MCLLPICLRSSTSDSSVNRRTPMSLRAFFSLLLYRFPVYCKFWPLNVHALSYLLHKFKNEFFYRLIYSIYKSFSSCLWSLRVNFSLIICCQCTKWIIFDIFNLFLPMSPPKISFYRLFHRPGITEINNSNISRYRYLSESSLILQRLL